MAVVASVQEFLRQSNIDYAVFRHAMAFTAQEEAAFAHVPGRDWAKVVACFADGQPILAVVSADRHVDLVELARLANADDVRLATEHELDWLFPDCERGAMPPFGPMYRQAVYVDAALAHESRIVFNAGTHADAVSMRYQDFALVTQPIVGQFSMRTQ
jgi:Ala-tRNA(Pro) deacylase